ncbi:hypothetical protein HDU98_008710, partial [Podochytrium sp. JEL0797]
STPTDASTTIATLRAQLDRAHALLSTQSQLTHRLKSELTVTRSHIATVNTELSARTAEVSTLRSSGLEKQVKKLEQEARDGRDAALLALEYIIRQGSTIGMEIEVEVMGVMRLLESPWTPLGQHTNGATQGVYTGVGVKRCWDSDSEFDSDVDVEGEVLGEEGGWWRLDLVKHVAAPAPPPVPVVPLPAREMDSDEASAESSTESESALILSTAPRSRSKRSHRWSTMSLTRPVLAYHESFSSKHASLIDLDTSEDDTEEENLMILRPPLTDETESLRISLPPNSISKRTSVYGNSPVPGTSGVLGGAVSPWGGSGRGFLERIPEDDGFLESRRRRLSRRGDEEEEEEGEVVVDMLHMTDIESVSSRGEEEVGVTEERRRGLGSVLEREGGGLGYDGVGGWGAFGEMEEEGVKGSEQMGLSIHPITSSPPTTLTAPSQFDSGIDLTSPSSPPPSPHAPRPLRRVASRLDRPTSRIDRPSSRLLWHQLDPPSQTQPLDTPLQNPEEPSLPDILWTGGSIKPAIPASTAPATLGTFHPTNDAETESIVWTGAIKSSTKSILKRVSNTIPVPSKGSDTMDPSVLFTGAVKSKHAPITSASEIQVAGEEIAAAESIMWTGSVKSKKASRKHALEIAAAAAGGSIVNGEEVYDADDAESIVFHGKVRSKKSTRTAARSVAGGGSMYGEDEDGGISVAQTGLENAESIVWRGTVKSKKSTIKAARSNLEGSQSQYAGDDVESIVWKGNVKSRVGGQSVVGSYQNSAVDDSESIVWQGKVKSTKRTTRKAKSVFSNQEEDSEEEEKPARAPEVQMSPELESVMWQGNVRSGNRLSGTFVAGAGAGKASSSLKQSVVFASVEQEVNALPGSDGSQGSGFGDFAKIPVPPVGQTESTGFFSTILKPTTVAAAATIPSPVAQQVQPKSSMSWFGTSSNPVEADQPPIPVNQVKPKQSTGWFSSLVAEDAEPVQEPLRATASQPILPVNQVKPKASTSSWFQPALAVVNDSGSDSDGTEVTAKPAPVNQVKPKASTSSWFQPSLAVANDTATTTESATQPSIPTPPTTIATLPSIPQQPPTLVRTTSVSAPTRPTPSSQVKPKPSTSWFSNPITSLLQAITDLVPELEDEEQPPSSLFIANTETETLFDAGTVTAWQKSEPDSVPGKRASLLKARPASVIRNRPASVLLSKRPGSVLMINRAGSSLSMRGEEVVERSGSSLSVREEVEEVEEVGVEDVDGKEDVVNVQVVEEGEVDVMIDEDRPTRASTIEPTPSSTRRSKSLETHPHHPPTTLSRRHSISLIDTSLRHQITPTFLASIPHQLPPHLLTKHDDSASESSTHSYLSTLSSTSTTDSTHRALTPSRSTTSHTHTPTTKNPRIKKRGSVSSSLHSEYTPPSNHLKPGPPQRRRSSFKPVAFDAGVNGDSPDVDQLAAALEGYLEAAIETPWHLVPKWLVIDEGGQKEEEVVGGEEEVVVVEG